jgi:hypothetical protein
VAASAGCSGVTEPESPGFEFASAPIFGVRRSPPVVEGGKGQIDLSGVFEVPHSAFTITGWLAVPGSRSVHLRVRGNPRAEGLQFASLHFYQSRVSRLPKGTYDVAISYEVMKGALRDSTVVWTGVTTVR